MIKSKNTKGFTLVELIIVITILAILATIAFISFQGYSKDARDTKRKSNINNLVKSMEVKVANGVSSSILGFASGSELSLSGVTAKIGGTGSIVDSDYKAGDANLTALGAPAEMIPDTGKTYKLGVSSKQGGLYQFAATMEGTQLAFVSGNYNPRKTAPSATLAAAADIDVSKETIYIPSGDIGELKIGDTITITATGLTLSPVTTEITGVSSDMRTYTVKADLATATSISAGGTITLAANEVGGLIGGVDSAGTFVNTNVVTDGGAIRPYVQ